MFTQVRRPRDRRKDGTSPRHGWSDPRPRPHPGLIQDVNDTEVLKLLVRKGLADVVDRRARHLVSLQHLKPGIPVAGRKNLLQFGTQCLISFAADRRTCQTAGRS